MSLQALDATLDAAEAARAFGPGSPPSADVLAEVEADLGPMPQTLRRVYSRAEGLQLPRVEVFDLADYEDVNGDEALSEQLPGVVFFASDRRGGYFLLDRGGSLGEPPGAVFWTDRGSLQPDDCRLAAPDVATFLALALSGEALTDGPEVGALSLDRLMDAAARHPDKVALHPGYGSPEALLAARDTGLPFPFGLIAFYERCDGLELLDMDLRIHGLRDVRAAEEACSSGLAPGALWIGADRAGRRLAVTCAGWRNLPENRLIVVSRPSELATAAPLGLFTDVLRVWIEDTPW